MRCSDFLVIDGQQRLATLSLLLSALGKSIEAHNVNIGTERSKIESDYLFNLGNNDFRYKLVLTKSDKDTFFQLIDETNGSDDNSLLFTNYNFFEEKLRGDNLKIVYEGIKKLQIVDIVLDSDDENPQLIFESLNSKGVELSQSDLIRNYVLMGQEEEFQNMLYEHYWYPMEKSFGAEYSKRFNSFIRDYLTLKTGQIPAEKKVYDSFKLHMPDKQSPEELERQIKDIVRYSEHYVCITLLKEEDRALHDCLKDLHELEGEAAYPLLLGVYEGYKQKRIEIEEVTDICRLIESYVFRRSICEMSTAVMRRMFARLSNRLKYERGCFYELRKELADLSENQLFPLDSEFEQQLLIKNVYRSRNRNYLLHKLENYERKEPVNFAEYEVERIMPETLNDEWKADLGDNYREVHETYLGTIGNLTLTRYNPELRNRSFQKKRDSQPSGFRHSPLWLNQTLVKVETWNKKAIVNRAKMLAEKALNIWRYHGMAAQQGNKGETIDKFPALVGEMRRLFMELQYYVENMHASVKWRITQRYVSFRATEVFMIIEPQSGVLHVSLKIPHSELNDPEQLAIDGSSKPKGGLSLGTDVFVEPTDDINYVMCLVSQTFKKRNPELLKEQEDYTPF